MNNKYSHQLLIAVLVLIIGLTSFWLVKLNHTSSQLTQNPNTLNNSAPTPTPTIHTSLFFAGDIMLSRNVGTKITNANNASLPFVKVTDRIQSADLSFANLESPFLNRGARITQGLVFKAEPESVEGLVNAGFDVLSTANNHSYDQGLDGVNYTLEWLKSNGIASVGTGLKCRSGTTKEVNGIKFGFLAYSYAAFNDGGRVPDPNVCNWNNQTNMESDIKILKSKVDFVIVSGHFGPEYQREPTSADSARARAAIDAGADMLVGHHPHWVQTIEEYNGKYIFYSLGNFVFDQMWSQDTREGLAVEVLFKGKALDTIRLLPVIIDDYCCPRWANDTETKSILNKINSHVETTTMVLNGRTALDWQKALVKPTLDKSPQLP